VNAVPSLELPDQAPERSHLHFDHCGDNKHLTAATTYPHRDELRQARTPEPFERLGYADKGFDHEGASFSLLEGDVEFANDIHLFHTVGHYSLMVEPELAPEPFNIGGGA